MSRCSECFQPMRASGGRCYECVNNPGNRSLPPGQWIGGLVKRFVPDTGRTTPKPIPPTLGYTCHCGCLLVNAKETCPACIAWAQTDAARHSWTQLKEAA